MNKNDYYESLKQLARDIRSQFDITTPKVGLSKLREIYKARGITIDLVSHNFKKLRGAYFNDECGKHVMIYKDLPNDPRVFTMAHELKHDLCDSQYSQVNCDFSENALIEIGAEIFAAELLFPEQDFADYLADIGVDKYKCEPCHIVRMKHETKTSLSYTGLVKRAEFLQFCDKGAFLGVKWKKLEEEIYGVPFYKQKQYRMRKIGSA